MEDNFAIQLFEGNKVRIVWDEEQEKYYFSVVDIVQVLTGSTNPTDYLKKLRKRDPELGSFLGTNCPQVEMRTFTGKKRMTLAADLQGIFRIIQVGVQFVPLLKFRHAPSPSGWVLRHFVLSIIGNFPSEFTAASCGAYVQRRVFFRPA